MEADAMNESPKIPALGDTDTEMEYVGAATEILSCTRSKMAISRAARRLIVTPNPWSPLTFAGN